LGPLDENEAITGAGFLPNNVLAGDILMVAPDFIGSLQKMELLFCSTSFENC